MTDILSDEDAKSLFSSVSKAMRDDDSEKLSTLLAQETPIEQEQPEEEPLDETPEEEDTAEEVDTPDDSKDEDTESAEDEIADKKETKDDPLAVLRAEIEALRKEQHSLKSQAGRVGSLQRRLAHYDEQLAKISNATSSQTSEKVKPKIEAALKDLEESDPVLAKAIANAVSEALNGVDSDIRTKEVERLTALRESDYDEYTTEQKNILLSRFPNVGQVFASNEWASWKKEQKPHMQALATSDDAEAVTLALNQYREDMFKKYPELRNQQTQEQESKVEDKVEEQPNEQARQIEEKRNKAKQTSVNLKDGKPPIRGQEPSDPGALFSKLFKEIKEGKR